jgi:hypothetical protein
MEYVITDALPFDDVEALATAALEQEGWSVQRTFSLSSAVGVDPRQAEDGNPNYSVLMLFVPGDSPRPLGLLTLLEQEGQVRLRLLHTGRTEGHWAVTDAEAGLVAALARTGVGFCVSAAGGEACIDHEELISNGGWRRQ